VARISKTKSAIKDLLAFLKTPVIEEEIVDSVKKYSKAKEKNKPRILNRDLNALYNTGVVEKYYLKDGKVFTYPPDQYINKKYPRLYKLIKPVFYRKEISVDEYIFCGSGQERKEKTTVRIKMWTFEDNRTDREEELKEALLEYLQGKYPYCYNPNYPDGYIEDIDELNNYAYDDSQQFDEDNVNVIFPETDMVED